MFIKDYLVFKIHFYYSNKQKQKCRFYFHLMSSYIVDFV